MEVIPLSQVLNREIYGEAHSIVKRLRYMKRVIHTVSQQTNSHPGKQTGSIAAQSTLSSG